MSRVRMAAIGGALLVALAAGAVVVAGPPSCSRPETASGPGPAVAQGSPHVSSSPEECAACEKKECTILLDECKTPECLGAVACFRKEKCATQWDNLDCCYCGETTVEDCFAGKAPPKGACKQQLETAAHDSQPLNIGARFFDRSFESGKAMQLAQCVLRNCPGCP